MRLGAETAKRALKLRERRPEFSPQHVGELSEVFNHPAFLQAPADEQEALMLASAAAKYESEIAYPWDHYFATDLRPLLRGIDALDLGSFTGGRAVAWYERYGLTSIAGVDVRREFVAAAGLFAARHDVVADFRLGRGEELPFGEASFDAVLSFDVLEHVQDLRATLHECLRVTRPGGLMLAVFPSYYHPTAHHLDLVSTTPCVHWVFPSRALMAAYDSILSDRGGDAAWYCRRTPTLEPWERGNTINGTTCASFRRCAAEAGWLLRAQIRLPVGAVGRTTEHDTVAHLAAHCLWPLTRVPRVQDLVLHRLTWVLQKPRS